jgi:hypothetical protein
VARCATAQGLVHLHCILMIGLNLIVNDRRSETKTYGGASKTMRSTGDEWKQALHAFVTFFFKNFKGRCRDNAPAQVTVGVRWEKFSSIKSRKEIKQK